MFKTTSSEMTYDRLPPGGINRSPLSGWLLVTAVLFSIVCGAVLVLEGPLAAVIVTGCLFALVLINQPFLALYVLVAAIGFDSINALRMGEIYSITIIKIVGVVLVISLVPAIAMGRIRFRVGKEIILVGVFLLLMLASFLGASSYSLSLKGILTYLQLAVLWVAVRLIITTPKRMRLTAKIIVLTLTVCAVIGIWQFLSNPYARITGISQNAAILSSNMYVGFWFALALLLTTQRKLSRFAWGVLLVAMFLVIIFSLARAAYIALIPSILIAGIYARKPGRSIGILVLLIILVLLFAPFVMHRMAQTTMADPSTRGHLYSIKAGLDMMFDHPFLGVGVENYVGNYLHYTQDPRGYPRTPHNSYLAIGAETGIPNLIVFLGLHIAALYALWKFKRRSGEADRMSSLFAMAIAGALVAISLIGLFHTLQMSKYLWILLALAFNFPLKRNSAKVS